MSTYASLVVYFYNSKCCCIVTLFTFFGFRIHFARLSFGLHISSFPLFIAFAVRCVYIYYRVVKNSMLFLFELKLYLMRANKLLASCYLFILSVFVIIIDISNGWFPKKQMAYYAIAICIPINFSRFVILRFMYRLQTTNKYGFIRCYHLILDWYFWW